ncbi:MAG: hypothetical protein AVDCRST_MAG23-2233, partial [uncultured Sphingosinicella sp.]
VRGDRNRLRALLFVDVFARGLPQPNPVHWHLPIISCGDRGRRRTDL